MKYEMEEILPIVRELTEKYTSKESSSIPYEKARELIEAIIYCVQEFEMNVARENLPQENLIDCQTAYRRGYDQVLQKVYETKNIYENMITDFNAYGCQNYRSTVMEGLPGFFLRYDPRFLPQDHILTLDYPPVVNIEGKTGIDLIHVYLKAIEAEQEFLSLFPQDRIISVLEKVQPDYRSVYMDNICQPILLTAVGLVIADTPLVNLYIGTEELRRIEAYFGRDDKETVAGKITRIYGLLLNQTKMDPEYKQYLFRVSKDHAARVWTGLQHGTLGNVFYVTEA